MTGIEKQDRIGEMMREYREESRRQAQAASKVRESERDQAAALIASQAARIRELEAEIAALKEGKFWRDELLKASLADRKRAIAALSRLDARFVEAEADTNSETGTLGETFATIDVSHLRKITAAAIGCQCGNCTEVSHASDCAVHNEPALPAGPCDCRARALLSRKGGE